MKDKIRLVFFQNVGLNNHTPLIPVCCTGSSPHRRKCNLSCLISELRRADFGNHYISSIIIILCNFTDISIKLNSITLILLVINLIIFLLPEPMENCCFCKIEFANWTWSSTISYIFWRILIGSLVKITSNVNKVQ